MTTTPLALTAPIVQLNGLQLAYDGLPVLNQLSWQVQPGQIIGLLGRNGAGKTTLMETLLGLREPDAGDATLFGDQAQRLSDATRARIGYVPQKSDLFDWMTPRQLLAYFRSFYPRWDEAKVNGLISRWAISADKPIRQLSGGQQQRLSIIRALAHSPELLVLDEPVASLDPAARRDFLRELVEQVVDHQTTVLFSTHILSDLERVAVDVAFMSQGRIGLQAPLDDLLESCHRLTGPLPEVSALLARLGVTPLHLQPLRGGQSQALVRSAQPIASQAAHGVQVDAVTLEDLFLDLTA